MTTLEYSGIPGGNAAVTPLLKRAFIFLEDGEWKSAVEYCERVLDMDPENARAYLGKLMAELHVQTQEELKDEEEPFDDNKNYQKAIRFADSTLRAVLVGYIDHIHDRNANLYLTNTYNRALNAMSAATTEVAYKKAASLFVTLGEYLDSASLAQTCYEKAEIAHKEARRIAQRNKRIFIIILIALCIAGICALFFNTPYGKYIYRMTALNNAEVGDSVFLGKYEQDNNIANGREDIEWLVLDIQDDKALLVSKYALDHKPYNTRQIDVSWETCSLRKWLNGDFLNTAFSAKEQEVIPVTIVPADKNPDYNTNSGKATQDRVFLLSIAEANQYFASDKERQCAPTNYAAANGTYVNRDNGNCWWWLRSAGVTRGDATGVAANGSIGSAGDDVAYAYNAVRPAIWVMLHN